MNFLFKKTKKKAGVRSVILLFSAAQPPLHTMSLFQTFFRVASIGFHCWTHTIAMAQFYIPGSWQKPKNHEDFLKKNFHMKSCKNVIPKRTQNETSQSEIEEVQRAPQCPN